MLRMWNSLCTFPIIPPMGEIGPLGHLLGGEPSLASTPLSLLLSLPPPPPLSALSPSLPHQHPASCISCTCLCSRCSCSSSSSPVPASAPPPSLCPSFCHNRSLHHCSSCTLLNPCSYSSTSRSSLLNSSATAVMNSSLNQTLKLEVAYW